MVNPLAKLAFGRIHVGDILKTHQLRFCSVFVLFLLRIRSVPAPYRVRPEVPLHGETTEQVCLWYVLDMASTHS